MNIEELSEASGISVRNIKRFIALGLVAPAIGRTRGARYSQTHLDDLARVVEAREKGHKVGKLAKAVNPEVGPLELGGLGSSLNLLVLPITEHSYFVLDQAKSNIEAKDRRLLIEEVRRATSAFLRG